VGALQLPVFHFIKTAVGTSSTFVTLAAHVLSFVTPSNDYLSSFMHTKKNYWQVAQDEGILIGSFIAANTCASAMKRRALEANPGTAPTPLRTEKKSEPLSPQKAMIAFTGGFTMLMGARLASGCTEGHGISGIAHMSVSSFLTVAAIAAAGVGAAALIPASTLKDD